VSKIESGRTIRLMQSFEVVSRHLSLTKAAAELGVTTSAVSHQLRQLSATLGEKLIEKSGRGIALTPLGLKLSKELGEAFSSIEQSISKAIGGNSNRVRIAVCSSFGPGWLAPRFRSLEDFIPEADFHLILYTQSPQLSDEVADVFVTTHPGAEGYWSMPLLEENWLAVGSIRNPGQHHISAFSKLVTTDTGDVNTGADWHDFAKTTKLHLNLPDKGIWIKCSHFILAMELAKCGAGVALVPEFLARSSLQAGTLRQVHSTSVPSGRQYHLCIKRSRRHEENLQGIATWFKAKVREYLEEPPAYPMP
jgi:LysR family transcriptional regulator, glycine cleavage system transcriptional activator